MSNLLDKRYYAKFSPNSTYFNNYYGDPRNVTVSLRARFRPRPACPPFPVFPVFLHGFSSRFSNLCT